MSLFLVFDHFVVRDWLNRLIVVLFLISFRSYAPNPISSASRSSLGIRSSLGGNEPQEPLNVSSAAGAATSTFPKDFMLNDHHSVGSAIVSASTATGGAHLGSSGLEHLGVVGGLEMPMEDLAASILSHLSQ